MNFPKSASSRLLKDVPPLSWAHGTIFQGSFCHLCLKLGSPEFSELTLGHIYSIPQFLWTDKLLLSKKTLGVLFRRRGSAADLPWISVVHPIKAAVGTDRRHVGCTDAAPTTVSTCGEPGYLIVRHVTTNHRVSQHEVLLTNWRSPGLFPSSKDTLPHLSKLKFLDEKSSNAKGN